MRVDARTPKGGDGNHGIRALPLVKFYWSCNELMTVKQNITLEVVLGRNCKVHVFLVNFQADISPICIMILFCDC